MTEAISEAEELVRNGAHGSAQGRNWLDRTECLRGHEYTPENTQWRKHGARRCRECHNAKNRHWYATRGAAARKPRRLTNQEISTNRKESA